MATDWIFYSLTRPLGLVLIAAGLAIPFAIWRVVMGSSFQEFGVRPLAAGYGASFLGLALLCFWSSYSEFSSRVDQGLLEEASRWSTVPGWTIYLAILSLLIVLPVLGFIAVPACAALLKKGWFNSKSISGLLVGSWSIPAIAVALLPSNLWEQGNPWQAMIEVLSESIAGVLLVGLPFFSAILITARITRRDET
ncbi:MAG: hypothetical protein P8X48_09670 [Acidiferrobacteraceae bacterium]